MLAHPAASQDPPVSGAGASSAERSERQLALGRRTARTRRIDGLCAPDEVRENPLDRCGSLDAGNHTKAAAAAPARLDLDGEYSHDALRPRQGRRPRGLWITSLPSGLVVLAGQYGLTNRTDDQHRHSG